jgi:hypothetical protein
MAGGHKGRQRRWRYLAAQRSGRVRVTITAVGVSMLAIVVATVLTQWQSQIRSATQTVATGLAQVGVLPVAVMLGLVLLVAATVICVTPLPKTHSYLATNPHRIPRVAIYLDYENQLPNAAIQPFLDHVRSFVGGRRAELVLFSDAILSATGKKYRSLVKGGFRPVDVPHKRVLDVEGDDRNSKNSVDVELALYAYQQALLSPHPMDIVLVSGDRDYIPLIRRLWVEGHHVHIWAMVIPPAIAELTQQLNIEAATFSSLFSWESADDAPAGVAQKRRRGKPRAASAEGKSARTKDEGSETRSRKTEDAASTQPKGNLGDEALDSPVGREQLVVAFAYSRQVLDRVRRSNGTGKSALKVLGSQIGDSHREVSEAFGFTGKGWTRRWFLLLQALELFTADSGVRIPLPGPIDAAQATDRLLHFLRELSECACTLATSTPDRTVTFASLQAQLAAVSTHAADTEMLRQVLANPSPEWPNPLVQLCRAASAVGLLRYERLAHGAGIRIGEC